MSENNDADNVPVLFSEEWEEEVENSYRISDAYADFKRENGVLENEDYEDVDFICFNCGRNLPCRHCAE